jgi:hypothetical protein
MAVEVEQLMLIVLHQMVTEVEVVEISMLNVQIVITEK